MIDLCLRRGKENLASLSILFLTPLFQADYLQVTLTLQLSLEEIEHKLAIVSSLSIPANLSDWAVLKNPTPVVLEMRCRC